jgi:hypothetical protein
MSNEDFPIPLPEKRRDYFLQAISKRLKDFNFSPTLSNSLTHPLAASYVLDCQGVRIGEIAGEHCSRWMYLKQGVVEMSAHDLEGMGFEGVWQIRPGGLDTLASIEAPFKIKGRTARKIIEETVKKENGFQDEKCSQAGDVVRRLQNSKLYSFSFSAKQVERGAAIALGITDLAEVKDESRKVTFNADNVLDY